jgi:dienelactone hydrolase
MTRIALFHSVLGLRPGVEAAAEVFRAAGHQVRVVDQYDGRVFSDYSEADAFAGALGYPALMQDALDAVSDDPGPFIVAGFSNGAGMAEYVAATRGGAAGGVVGSLQFAGAMPLTMLGLSDWPMQTPVQLHYTIGDPFRDQAWVQGFVDSVTASRSPIETFLDYPKAGHLFTDESLPAEYDEESAALAYRRALDFLERAALTTTRPDRESVPNS